MEKCHLLVKKNIFRVNQRGFRGAKLRNVHVIYNYWRKKHGGISIFSMFLKNSTKKYMTNNIKFYSRSRQLHISVC